jgi:RNA polymerase sigma-70 factor (ECF subfamily)
VNAFSSQSDQELVAKAQTGSVPAFAELISRFETRLFNFLLRRSTAAGRSVIGTEDLTQETFVRAWQSIHRYQPRYRFSTWLFTIGARLARDAQRTQRRWRTHDQRAGQAWHEQTDAAPLWDLAEQVLTQDQHSALWLRYAEDLSIAETARVLGRTQIGTRVLLHRARTRLAEHATSAQLDHDDARSHATSAPAGAVIEPLSAPAPRRTFRVTHLAERSLPAAGKTR